MGRGVTTIDVLSFTVHGSCDGFSGHAFRLSPQPSLSSLPPLSCPSFPRPLLIAFHDLTWVFHSAAEMITILINIVCSFLSFPCPHREGFHPLPPLPCNLTSRVLCTTPSEPSRP
mmetsp:Transcript_10230/g.24094  ORF Transcript_10230/g.24094 Transcript_10230/m.24094 type:complete len:115 (-) Transcript_10230:1232-1576(-)